MLPLSVLEGLRISALMKGGTRERSSVGLAAVYASKVDASSLYGAGLFGGERVGYQAEVELGLCRQSVRLV